MVGKEKVCVCVCIKLSKKKSNKKCSTAGVVSRKGKGSATRDYAGALWDTKPIGELQKCFGKKAVGQW